MHLMLFPLPSFPLPLWLSVRPHVHIPKEARVHEAKEVVIGVRGVVLIVRNMLRDN